MTGSNSERGAFGSICLFKYYCCGYYSNISYLQNCGFTQHKSFITAHGFRGPEFWGSWAGNLCWGSCAGWSDGGWAGGPPLGHPCTVPGTWAGKS